MPSVLFAVSLSATIQSWLSQHILSGPSLVLWLPLALLNGILDFSSKSAAVVVVVVEPAHPLLLQHNSTSPPVLPSTPTPTTIYQPGPALPWLAPLIIILLAALTTATLLRSWTPRGPQLPRPPQPSTFPADDTPPRPTARLTSWFLHTLSLVVLSALLAIEDIKHAVLDGSLSFDLERLTGPPPSTPQLARAALEVLITHAWTSAGVPPALAFDLAAASVVFVILAGTTLRGTAVTRPLPAAAAAFAPEDEDEDDDAGDGETYFVTADRDQDQEQEQEQEQERDDDEDDDDVLDPEGGEAGSVSDEEEEEEEDGGFDVDVDIGSDTDTDINVNINIEPDTVLNTDTTTTTNPEPESEPESEVEAEVEEVLPAVVVGGDAAFADLENELAEEGEVEVEVVEVVEVEVVEAEVVEGVRVVVVEVVEVVEAVEAEVVEELMVVVEAVAGVAQEAEAEREAAVEEEQEESGEAVEAGCEAGIEAVVAVVEEAVEAVEETAVLLEPEILDFETAVDDELDVSELSEVPAPAPHNDNNDNDNDDKTPPTPAAHEVVGLDVEKEAIRDAPGDSTVPLYVLFDVPESAPAPADGTGEGTGFEEELLGPEVLDDDVVDPDWVIEVDDNVPEATAPVDCSEDSIYFFALFDIDDEPTVTLIDPSEENTLSEGPFDLPEERFEVLEALHDEDLEPNTVPEVEVEIDIPAATVLVDSTNDEDDTAFYNLFDLPNECSEGLETSTAEIVDPVVDVDITEATTLIDSTDDSTHSLFALFDLPDLETPTAEIPELEGDGSFFSELFDIPEPSSSFTEPAGATEARDEEDEVVEPGEGRPDPEELVQQEGKPVSEVCDTAIAALPVHNEGPIPDGAAEDATTPDVEDDQPEVLAQEKPQLQDYDVAAYSAELPFHDEDEPEPEVYDTVLPFHDGETISEDAISPYVAEDRPELFVPKEHRVEVYDVAAYSPELPFHDDEDEDWEEATDGEVEDQDPPHVYVEWSVEPLVLVQDDCMSPLPSPSPSSIFPANEEMSDADESDNSESFVFSFPPALIDDLLETRMEEGMIEESGEYTREMIVEEWSMAEVSIGGIVLERVMGGGEVEVEEEEEEEEEDEKSFEMPEFFNDNNDDDEGADAEAVTCDAELQADDGSIFPDPDRNASSWLSSLDVDAKDSTDLADLSFITSTPPKTRANAIPGSPPSAFPHADDDEDPFDALFTFPCTPSSDELITGPSPSELLQFSAPEPVTPPAQTRQPYPPGINIWSPSPRAHPSPTPPPGTHAFPAFLEVVERASFGSPSPSPSPSSSHSGSLSSLVSLSSLPSPAASPPIRSSSEPEPVLERVPYDPGDPDTSLDMEDILAQCEGYENLMDPIEDWPGEPDVAEDWEHTTGSLEKLEEMRVKKLACGLVVDVAGHAAGDGGDVLRTTQWEQVEIEDEGRKAEQQRADEDAAFQAVMDTCQTVALLGLDLDAEELKGSPEMKAFEAAKRWAEVVAGRARVGAKEARRLEVVARATPPVMEAVSPYRMESSSSRGVPSTTAPGTRAWGRGRRLV